TEILGDGQKVTGLKLSTGDELSLDQIYIEIGGVPGSALLIPLGVEVDQGGYIKVDEKLTTNVQGIFAAGDIVNAGFSIEQISTAVGLGARAAVSAFSYLKQQTPPTLWGESQIRR
ncbi:MAG: FAD-dependent oxidoreductase, partial [Candidatus Curtissbacteria bacterium]|nr:FAD-dependent oxidoreductase [Candidatus Curtissbacteria bacterium]